jgi:hypothetical protein|tara:strand:+ start:1176 stop:1403 length:228 start_codon:yes stop_codon:yes gene_type:complete
MAYVVVPGSNNLWQYDNAAVKSDSDTYNESNGTVANGIRTFTTPGGNVERVYIKCRKVGETIVRGELNKNYYDAQ